MTAVDKQKILNFMEKRKQELYNRITRDFGGGNSGPLDQHNELKYWKEAIESGEFDVEVPEGGDVNDSKVSTSY